MKKRLIILTMLSLVFGMTSMAQKTIRYDLVKIIFEDGSEQKAQGYVFVTFKNNYKSFYISNHKGTRAKGHDLEGFYSGYSSKKFPGATGAFAIEDCTFYDPVDFSYVKKIGNVNIYKAKRTIRQAVSHGMNFIVEPTKRVDDVVKISKDFKRINAQPFPEVTRGNGWLGMRPFDNGVTNRRGKIFVFQRHANEQINGQMY